MQSTIQSILSRDQTKLESILKLGLASARIEIQCLLEHVLSVNRAYLFAHPEHILNITENNYYLVLLQRRMSGEPIAYILGNREFFGLNLFITHDTLIPRPETELLVELALERSSVSKQLILDLGTGSGAIALAIAHYRPEADIFACDFSSSALTVAQSNALRLGITNVHFVESDWFSSFCGHRFDIIVSNPPYIAIDDPHLSQGDVRYEPNSALVSGKDGLDDISQIILQSGAHLNPGGWLLLEHGYDQAQRVRELLQNSGFESVFSAKDISGIERCSGGQFRK